MPLLKGKEKTIFTQSPPYCIRKRKKNEDIRRLEFDAGDKENNDYSTHYYY